VHLTAFHTRTPDTTVGGGNESWNNVVPEKYRPTMMLKAREEYEQERGYRFNKIIRGNKEKKLIALTFDDGPHGVYTVKLLDVLKQTHTPATFFLVGKQVDKYPGLVQLEVMNGNEVGNHTYDHVDLTQIPPELIGFELDECDRAIKRAIGVSPRFFRPPGGDYDLNVVREATRRSYVTSLWTDDPGDYAKPGADVVMQRTLDRLENGAIILLHDGIPETVDILPALIAQARKRGYEFVTLSELAKQR
jgi:peptidoglycan/xylan/chitin deacetylase (PgdA/CDA1 family)